MSIPTRSALLKNKNFIRLWISQAASLISIYIVIYILILRLYSQTNSTLAVSFLWISYSLPVLLFGPFASTVVDLVDRKLLLTISNLLQAGTLLILVPFHSNFFLAYGIIFIYCLINQFYLPAESASLPSLIPQKYLAQGNGLFLLTKQASTLIGFGAAGLLTKFLGTDISILFCAGLLIIAFFSVLSLPSLNHKHPLNFEANIQSFFQQVVEGYKFIKDHRNILFPVLLISGTDIIFTILAVSVPALATEVIGVKLENAAFLFIVPSAIGAIAGVIFFPQILKKGMRKKLLIETSLLVITASLFIIGVLIGFIPHYARLVLAPIVAIFIGLGFAGVYIPAQTYLQETAPNKMLGRLFGTIWFTVTMATIPPLILSASLTELIGVRSLFSLLTIGILSVAIYSKYFGDRAITNHFADQYPTN